MKNDVKRIYVCKKDEFDYKSKNLVKEIKNSLGIDVKSLKSYRRYDVEISDETLDKTLYTVFAEAPVDEVYYKDAKKLEESFTNPIGIAYLPGQFDNREESLIQTIALFSKENIRAKVIEVYDIAGVNEEELQKIKDFLINPVDSTEVDVYKEVNLKNNSEKNLENIVYDGFNDLDEEGLNKFVDDKNLAMSAADLKVLQDYFKTENRDPNETEVAIIDTYWSDHCRHTTFNTELKIDFDVVTELDREIKKTFDEYLKMREDLGIQKPITLMSLGTILAKELRKNGKLDDLEVSSEINACSVKIKARIEVDGKEELRDYLLMFKNETHNHPTEIEPVGGASTCLGGAIRDPLSGRSYVYQAMRVTGAADPFTPISETLEGKLPQKKITTEAALGYASYGNQIGLATGLVDELYHPGYVAKRMETGAVIAAAPAENVKRLDPQAGDVVILLGGKTGRDGIGGATGSSKSHTVESIETESAQVQKGNAPEERKIQRLFRKGEAAKLIKKCNDFGAGGVSVAIGELADSIEIQLDKVPLKYQGLKPREIAISESQERMAVVVASDDAEKFISLADEENLEATIVAKVTDDNRMKMFYEDKLIVDMSYDFINETGADRVEEVEVVSEDVAKFLTNEDKEVQNLDKYLKNLNITSKKNMIELFDSTVGASTVLSPLGGKKQNTPAQVMAALIPTLEGDAKTASVMSYGFNPHLSEQSQYLGGYYAVIESIAKLISAGASVDGIRLSFQEYYEKMDNKKSWSKPLKSLLGALRASRFFDAPPIGGKDSMSGSFEDINVPPTLISFAVKTADVEDIISPEFKAKGKIGLVLAKRDEIGTLDLEDLKEKFEKINEDIKAKNIISAAAITHKGTLPQIYEMAIDNTGFEVNLKDLYSPLYGSFIVEYLEDRDYIEEVGKFVEDKMIVNGEEIDENLARNAYLKTLDEIFKYTDSTKLEKFQQKSVENRIRKSKAPVDEVKVIVPAFPGTNSEWDTAKAFEDAGAKAEIVVFKNRNEEEVEKSLEELAEKIANAQILAIPGGFSLGDEPDGSGKFIANVIRSEKVKAAIEKLLDENDGLILGICNGFQALIKTGLLPYGKVGDLKEEDPTLTFNTCNRHISRLVDTKVVSNNSPWLVNLEVGKTYKVPISHGEGRLVASDEMIEELLDNEQVAICYENAPNGSRLNVEALVSRDGKILGKMGHSERVGENLYKNIDGVEMQDIFKAGVEYFKK
ncbi:phosphoribosylformylglycinamidine synthase [Peptoniphilus sp. MSJ-1]|uniref:Phosphoribosylformylglycinamidine synthase n=1 Tax=Peptoniphilus ovalis TaxID=2841503 RepID=A0ABS6FET9_9FIRM|nr:phosphoribosylformylglycinamidine synthase [Peptoniphilus ovalis]MBU5668693.1 phosphoribosylformylglycinamidine synthase [Peptoniphilus ovalis]